MPALTAFRYGKPVVIVSYTKVLKLSKGDRVTYFVIESNIRLIFYYNKFVITLINISTQFHIVDRYTDFEKAIGLKFKELREKRGLTQEELAELAGVNQNQISRLENATYGTTITTIISVAIALGYEPKELLDVKEKLNLNSDFDSINKKKTPTTKTLHRLLKTDFLDSPKSVKQIADECKKRFDIELKSAALSGALIKLYERKILKRSPATIRGRYVYEKHK